MERPILFSGPMVRAILAGTKTQTRRVVKPQPELYQGHLHLDDQTVSMRWKDKIATPLAVAPRCLAKFCSYGAPGDRLWVRETWKPWPNTAGPELRGPDGMGAIYAATWDKSGGHGWKPSIHMPRWASRVALEVTGVRVERVQDISEADAKAEGAPVGEWFKDDLDGGRLVKADRRLGFRVLWDSINAKRGYGWEVSPWVWVVEFKAARDA